MERELPNRIRDLSLSLTADREGGPRPGYLSDPRELAAYAWYFLPWNLLRLCRLLPGLDLTLPEDGLVCDLGTGPLTLPLALWLSRPDLRRTRLRFVCTDRSRRALDLGVRLFTEVAGFDPTSRDAPWRMRCIRGEYWQGLVEGAHLLAMLDGDLPGFFSGVAAGKTPAPKALLVYDANPAYGLPETAAMRLETSLPSVKPLTPAHYVRQGGVGLVIYEVNKEVAKSGVQVGDLFFPGYKQKSGQYACLFAFPDTIPAEAFKPRLFVEDMPATRRFTAIATKAGRWKW